MRKLRTRGVGLEPIFFLSKILIAQNPELFTDRAHRTHSV